MMRRRRASTGRIVFMGPGLSLRENRDDSEEGISPG
jgi:hypothetical protein